MGMQPELRDPLTAVRSCSRLDLDPLQLVEPEPSPGTGKVDVSTFTRVSGYLGVVAFLGALAILAIVPDPSCCTSDVRQRAADAGLIGYVLILYRLGYLAVRGSDRGTRALSALGTVALVVAAIALFIGIRLSAQPTTVIS